MPALSALDYSFGRPSIPAMKAAGIKVVCRYLTGAGKALTRAEAVELDEAGIAILLNFEANAGDALAGASKGASNGAIAREAAANLGVPAGFPIYFSVDQDILSGQLPIVTEYLHAADNAAHQSRCYGEYDVVNAFGRPAWQTVAWSGGKLSKLAVIYQYEINQTLGGAAVDHNQIINLAGIGAWRPSAQSPTKPVTTEDDMAVKPYIGADGDGNYWVIAADLSTRVEVSKSFAAGLLASGNYNKVPPGGDATTLSHIPIAK